MCRRCNKLVEPLEGCLRPGLADTEARYSGPEASATPAEAFAAGRRYERTAGEVAARRRELLDQWPTRIARLREAAAR